MASSESAAALQQQLAALTAVLQARALSETQVLAAMSTSTAANGAATQHAALPRASRAADSCMPQEHPCAWRRPQRQ